jgi:hypothetical protein
MANFTYPSNDLESPKVLLSLLGSHWRNVYQGDLVESFAFARGQEERQSHGNLLEAVDAVSRNKIPVFHTENWHKLVIKESETNKTGANYLRYGDNSDPTYGNHAVTGIVHRYGERDIDIFAFPLPADLKDCDLIFNTITSPTVSYVYGQDFFIEQGSIVFKKNPFATSAIDIQEVYEGTTVVDREASLWIYKAKLERNYITEHYGHTLGYDLPSSEDYKKLVNAAYDAIVGGTTRQEIDLTLSALTGVEVVKNPREIVEHILYDSKGMVIVTDLEAYRFNRQAGAIVAVGDEVGAGDYLTDSVVVHELNQAEIPPFLNRLNFGPGVLAPQFIGELSFENASTTLNVTTKDSKAYLTFDIGGFPGDVERFFDDLHDKGLAEGKTLAQYLDTRGDSQNSEPTASTLPTTINPLQFLVDNLLRFNLFAIKIQTHSINTELGLHRTRIFRKLLPPWTAVVILYELEPDDEAVIMDGAGSATEPGYTESPSSFVATKVEETISPLCAGWETFSGDGWMEMTADDWEEFGLSSDDPCIFERPEIYQVNGACR